MDEAQRKITERVDFPSGTYFAMGGTAQACAEAQRDLLLHAAVGLLGVVLLPSIVAEHWRNLALLLFNLPLALASGQPRGEIDGPMAIVILGGLVTSTLLNLLMLPTLALRYGRVMPGA